jgi:hypothetical protein
MYKSSVGFHEQEDAEEGEILIRGEREYFHRCLLSIEDGTIFLWLGYKSIVLDFKKRGKIHFMNPTSNSCEVRPSNNMPSINCQAWISHSAAGPLLLYFENRQSTRQGYCTVIAMVWMWLSVPQKFMC